MPRVVFCLLFFFICVCGQAPQPQRSYAQSYLISSNTSFYYKLYWQPEGDGVNMRFAIVCTLGGWCGVGWSSTGEMVGSDAIIGSIGSQGLVVRDFILNAQETPSNCPSAVCPDDHPNITGCQNNAMNISGFNVANYMVLEFIRPLKASDPCDKDIPQMGTLIFSIGPGEVPTTMEQHYFRGNISFNWYPQIDAAVNTTTSGQMSSSFVKNPNFLFVAIFIPVIIVAFSGLLIGVEAYRRQRMKHGDKINSEVGKDKSDTDSQLATVQTQEAPTSSGKKDDFSESDKSSSVF